MYIEHFGLTREPFSLTPDPAFLYLSPEHREALAAVQYGLLDGRGFITLIGEVGTGKTTLLYSILGQRHAELEAAYVSYSAQSFEDLLATALRDLGWDVAAGASKRTMLDTLNQHLVRRADEGRTTALIIDEAQNLSDSAFEDLRLLSNFETYSRKLLQIVLVGQPELQERLRQPRLRQLRERVSVRAYVNPLPRAEMMRYIAHRLERAGGTIECFTPWALRTIVRQAAGIPRRANILCHNALLFAYGHEQPVVGATEAREAVAEMRERRPGRIPRSALRRMRWDTGIWQWGFSLGAALAVGLAAGNMWSTHAPSEPFAAVPSEQLGEAARSPVVAGDAVAAPAPTEPLAIEESDEEDAPARQVEVAIAAPTPAEEAAAPERAAGSPAPDARAIVVPRGATLWELLRAANGPGARREALFARARELNPQVKDVNVIIAGDRLLLPVPPAPAAAAEDLP